MKVIKSLFFVLFCSSIFAQYAHIVTDDGDSYEEMIIDDAKKYIRILNDKGRLIQIWRSHIKEITSIDRDQLTIMDGVYTFQKILYFDNRAQSDIYNRIAQWISLNYTSPDAIIYQSEPSQLVVRGLFSDVRANKNSHDWLHNMTIDCKDNRMRIKVSRLVLVGHGGYLFDLEDSSLMAQKEKIASLNRVIDAMIYHINQFVQKEEESW